jgi:hypothetical protein
MAVTANRLLVLKRMVGSFLRVGGLPMLANLRVKTALCAGLTELSFSQTVFVIGDKPGLFKGKSSFFSFFSNKKTD